MKEEKCEKCGSTITESNDLTGCVFKLLLVVLLMPIAGLIFMFSKDPTKKVLGWILLIGGLIIWLVLAANGGS